MQRNRRSFTIAAAVLAALFTVVSGALAAGSAKDAGPSGPMTIEAESYSLSTPVRDLEPRDRPPSRGHAPPRINPLAGDPGQGRRGTRSAETPADPLADKAGRSSGRTPPADLVFDGIQNPFACGCLPPDTIGDVGPNHYIQMTNATKVAIFSKTGTPLEPAFDLGDLWPAADNCANNRGDPVVLYDEIADRWLLSQFQGPSNPALCFAISETADPQGAFHLYRFNTSEFPDYFKVGVWPTGYYVSANESSYTAYAFDRTKMLAGDASASGIRFAGQTNFLMPADVDGPTAPDPQGGLFYTFKDNAFPDHGGGVDRIELFQLTPDFTAPASSTFGLIETIPITSFTYTVCGFFVLDCIPQPGTAEGLDPVSEWPMWRLAYRRFADREALVGNFTVDVGSDRAGIRWFELRDTGPGGYSLFQEGTHAPGSGVHRWMGSIAMDGEGNIALGYSASNSTTLFPSIRYATRCVGDPLGTLQAEQTLHAGAGSQTSPANRWGDYSAMSIDPSDDSTFWYTNEYYSSTSDSDWKTKIGNFGSGCGPPPPTHTLNVSRAGTGNGTVTGPGINCPGDCSEDYPESTAVSLNASPAAGSTFDGWSGDCAGTATCNLTMDEDKSATATFTLTPTDRHTLNVSLAGTGSGAVTGPGINCPGDCSEDYDEGTAVTLNASPAAGSTFAGWSGDCAGTGSCNLTMDEDKSATATFNPAPPPPDGVEPSNFFTLGALERNKRKGTATLSVDVPGPGTLDLSGPGVKPQRPLSRGRGAERPVAAAGTVELLIKATGNKKKKLKRKGKVRVRPTITYTPTGGTPRSEQKSVRLKRKRRR